MYSDLDAVERRLYGDPELTGELKLLALAMARLRHEEHEDDPIFDVIALTRMTGLTMRRVWELVAADRPRLEPVTAYVGSRPADGALCRLGGQLARHFPDVDWEALYAFAWPGWTPPDVSPRPHLTLIRGGRRAGAPPTPAR